MAAKSLKIFFRKKNHLVKYRTLYDHFFRQGISERKKCSVGKVEEAEQMGGSMIYSSERPLIQLTHICFKTSMSQLKPIQSECSI
jgi:hypothetical protein